MRSPHIHNVMVKYAKKLLKRLKHHEGYRELRKQYAAIMEKERPLPKGGKLSKPEMALKKQLSADMNVVRRDMGLSEAGVHAYIKKYGAMFCKCLSSQQIQKEATRVWTGVRRILFGDGKDIHFKKYMDFDTISGKTSTNGVKLTKRAFPSPGLGLRLNAGSQRSPLTPFIQPRA